MFGLKSYADDMSSPKIQWDDFFRNLLKNLCWRQVVGIGYDKCYFHLYLFHGAKNRYDRVFWKLSRRFLVSMPRDDQREISIVTTCCRNSLLIFNYILFHRRRAACTLSVLVLFFVSDCSTFLLRIWVFFLVAFDSHLPPSALHHCRSFKTIGDSTPLPASILHCHHNR